MCCRLPTTLVKSSSVRFLNAFIMSIISSLREALEANSFEMSNMLQGKLHLLSCSLTPNIHTHHQEGHSRSQQPGTTPKHHPLASRKHRHLPARAGMSLVSRRVRLTFIKTA